ncbi:hypothetical protein BD410DRAFT_814310 [Rickenella mellea]|uniref:Shr3 amino acid permease chaperone n=1 Tax=Rickenella mellea TaxID=50990 RepID=A0A4Y7Q7M6_9AGAM|nr:hypothetical protein BD410DRAFT_814310 [Rickenella mellea]
MGFKLAGLLASVSFVMGILFVCFNVDHRLLYQDITEQTIEDGFQFYTTFYNAPPAIKALLHTMVGVGLVSTMGKLFTWDESAMFFDGSCVAIFVFAIAVYLSVTIPSLRTIVDPVPKVDTREDRVEAMRILAAGNTIIIVLLGAILCLQAGQEYARRVTAKELARLDALEKETNAAAKKDS